MAEARAPRFNIWTLTGGKALLEKRGFRRLLLTRVLAQLGQNAIFYALFVLVAQKTNASIYTGLLVIVFAVPAAIFGPLSGVVIDRVSRGWLLVAVNGLRLIMCLALAASDQSVWILYLFSLVFATSMQFVGPAESAALAQVVEPEELTEANSLFNLGGLAGQARGMAIIAPIFLKTVGATPLFILAGCLFTAAAVIIATVPRLGAASAPRYPSGAGVRVQFARAWRTLRGDEQAYMALIMSVVGSTSVLICVAIVPRYAKSVLGVSAENMIFVFSPAALGLLLGLRLAGWLEGLLGKARTVSLGFLLLVMSLLAFGLTSRLGLPPGPPEPARRVRPRATARSQRANHRNDVDGGAGRVRLLADQRGQSRPHKRARRRGDAGARLCGPERARQCGVDRLPWWWRAASRTGWACNRWRWASPSSCPSSSSG